VADVAVAATLFAVRVRATAPDASPAEGAIDIAVDRPLVYLKNFITPVFPG
jgi:hypothetical protein